MEKERININGFKLIALAVNHKRISQLFSLARQFELAKKAYEDPEADTAIPYADEESRLHHMQEIASTLVHRLLSVNGKCVWLIGRGFIKTWIDKESIDDAVSLAEEFTEKLFETFRQ